MCISRSHLLCAQVPRVVLSPCNCSFFWADDKSQWLPGSTQSPEFCTQKVWVVIRYRADLVVSLLCIKHVLFYATALRGTHSLSATQLMHSINAHASSKASLLPWIPQCRKQLRKEGRVKEYGWCLHESCIPQASERKPEWEWWAGWDAPGLSGCGCGLELPSWLITTLLAQDLFVKCLCT